MPEQAGYTPPVTGGYAGVNIVVVLTGSIGDVGGTYVHILAPNSTNPIIFFFFLLSLMEI